MSVPTFSGTHAFRRFCVVDAALEALAMLKLEHPDVVAEPSLPPGWSAERRADQVAIQVVASLDAGLCPRCGEPFPADPKWMPSGSRITACRCIPVCDRCGTREALNLASLLCWPVSVDQHDDNFDFDEAKAAYLQTRGVPRDAILDGDHLIDGEGAHPIASRPHPRGWAEYGFDDEP